MRTSYYNWYTGRTKYHRLAQLEQTRKEMEQNRTKKEDNKNNNQ